MDTGRIERVRTPRPAAPTTRELAEVLDLRQRRRAELEDTIDDVIHKCDEVTGDFEAVGVGAEIDLDDLDDTDDAEFDAVAVSAARACRR